MSVAATSWAWKQDTGDGGTKATLVALADFADERGSCYPSQATLARMTCQSERTVRRHLHELEQRGLLSRKSRFLEGHRSTDRYVLPLNQTGQSDRKQPDTVTAGQSDRMAPPATMEQTGQIDRRSSTTANRTSTTVQTGQSDQVTVSEPSVEPSGGPRRRGTRLPDDFAATDDMRSWAQSTAPWLDVDWVTAKFVDYWTSVTGERAAKLDWVRTWRNWVRNEIERTPEHKRGNPTGNGKTSWTMWDNVVTADTPR